MAPGALKVIVVDDEKGVRESIGSALKAEGMDVGAVGSATEALRKMRNRFYDAAVIDIRIGAQSGLELFRAMADEAIDTPVVFISAHATLDEAAESIKLGAYDFIEKPFSIEKLLVSIRNCVDNYNLRERVNALRSSAGESEILGEHHSVGKLRRQIAKAAASEAAIFISGETGTGKELIARSVHRHSGRASERFVAVNCSAIPEPLVESTLFGHVKGAFTGADRNKKGFFESAHRGTLFLDEIGDLPLNSQARLLRVLENREIQKVGADEPSNVDVRIVAASHKNLKDEVEQGRFREDLYYRLNIILLNSPPLRERLSDIPLLASHFVEVICRRHGMPTKAIDNRCFAVFQDYSWPGNVRELFNVIERMVIMGGERLTKGDIPADILPRGTPDSEPDGTTLKGFIQNAERDYIVKQLELCGGNITKTAQRLSIDRSSLHKKIEQHGIKSRKHFN